MPLSGTRTVRSRHREWYRRNEAGFSLMEVLIATFILAVVVTTINLSCKQFFDMQGKMRQMENIYLSALSLKDRIESSPYEGDRTETGQINGLDYRFTLVQVAEKSNFVHGTERLKGGHVGSFALKLLRVELQLAGRSYTFLTTRSELASTPVQGGR